MHTRRSVLLSQLTSRVKLHSFNLPDAANVMRITQKISLGDEVSIDKGSCCPYHAAMASSVMKTSRFKKEGFSLLELLIVLAIMAIVSAIAAPNFMNYLAERRLNGAARQVMSDLMSARQKAVSQGHEFRVFFNGDNHSYTILDDTNSNGTADTGEATEGRDLHPDYYDVTFTSTANPIFYPRGTAWGTTVTLSSSRTGVSKYVKVASTGRVKIDDVP